MFKGFLGLAAMLLISLGLEAAVIFEESFDYTPVAPGNGVALNGFVGGTSGTGFTSGWGGDVAYATTGLTHTLVSSAGGAAEVVSNSGANGRSFGAGAFTGDGAVQYVSFLFNFNGNSPDAGADRTLFFSTSSGNGAGLEFGTGGTILTRLSGLVGGGAPVPFDTSTTQLAVLRIAWSDLGNDSIEAWLNPTSLTLGAPDLLQTGNISVNDGFYLRNQNANYFVDELRMGTLITDVLTAPAGAPVPEPSTFVLAALSVLSIACIRRRRQQNA